MKRTLLRACTGLLILIISTSCGKQHEYQRKINFNDGWKFQYGDVPEASDPSFDDTNWRIIDLPHDWAIEFPVAESNPSGAANGYFIGETGWYRKTFTIEPQHQGKSSYLLFGGIFMDAEIWVNGNYKGKHNYGYINHVYEVTQDLEAGRENVIAVRVDNTIQPSDRWYHGCGIYRDVEMIYAGPVHVKPWGTYIRNSRFDPLKTEIQISTEIKNDGDDPLEIKVISHLYHPEHGKVAVVSTSDLLLDKSLLIDQLVEIERPDLWSPDNPVVYECVTDILTTGNIILDTYISRFGIREANFTPEQGFVLNGKKLMMKGVCLHHDMGATGAAYYPSLMKRRLEVLKDAGVNAIRLSHNPYDPHVLDLCDEMGFVVMDELYDKWEKEWWQEEPFRKPFMETWEKDLESFVKRDRNHPSVVIWSTGNETMEQLQDPVRGLEIHRMLKARFNELDPSRPVTCAMHPHGELPSRIIHETDVVSYNYQVEMFEKWREEFPDYIFLGSETKVYQEGRVDSYADLDFSKNTWFMLTKADAGQFVWAGIDYFGESRGWPDKGIRTGFINSCGFLKPYGQFQKSIYSEKPMVHITVLDEAEREKLEALDTWQILWYGPPLVSHWNHSSDSVTLYVFSNLEKVDIYLNERIISSLNTADFPGNVVSLTVPYEKGTIRATASAHGKSAEHKLFTAGNPVKIHAEAIEYPEDKDYDNVIQYIVSIRDENNNLCPVSAINILAEYDENIRFLGADNGDMSDHQLFTEDSRTIRDGQCLFIFKRTERAKEFELRFEAEGLEPFIVNVSN